jgi:hypothetical protein
VNKLSGKVFVLNSILVVALCHVVTVLIVVLKRFVIWLVSINKIHFTDIIEPISGKFSMFESAERFLPLLTGALPATYEFCQ